MKEILLRIITVMFWLSFVLSSLLVIFYSFEYYKPKKVIDNNKSTINCNDQTYSFASLGISQYSENVYFTTYDNQSISNVCGLSKSTYTLIQQNEGSWIYVILWIIGGVSIAWISLYLISNIFVYIVTGNSISWAGVFLPLVIIIGMFISSKKNTEEELEE